MELQKMSPDKNKNVARLLIATVALIVVTVFLVAFVFISYNNKRKSLEEVSDTDVKTVSPTEIVSQTEIEPTSIQTTAPTETTTTTYFVDMAKNKNEFIKNPNYESDYYVVIYTKSQSVVTYKKDKNGGYTKLYKRLKCSTGVHDVTPTKEGVYAIVKKFRWFRLMGGVYGQYCCRFSEEDGYYLHSVPYKAKDPSTLSDSAYDKLGSSASHGCVRLCARDAKWIYDHIPVGTQVCVVWEKGPYGLSVPKRDPDPKYSGWDPSDRWSPGNPYFEETTTEAASATTEANPDTSAAETAATSAATAATESAASDNGGQ